MSKRLVLNDPKSTLNDPKVVLKAVSPEGADLVTEITDPSSPGAVVHQAEEAHAKHLGRDRGS